MSETKTGWASMTAVADMLKAAGSIESIEFYVTKYENSPSELNCRIFGLPGMSKSEIEVLADSLNQAIAPVLRINESSLKNKAANQLRRFL